MECITYHYYYIVVPTSVNYSELAVWNVRTRFENGITLCGNMSDG